MQLLEREQCLADLAEWRDAAVTRSGCIALVGGEAGIGKTSLLRTFAAQSSSRLLWGACDALFTPRPLAPLHDIARQAQGALLTVVSSDAQRNAIFSAALDALEQAPALVVFEDMHWADAATLDLIKFLGRRIERTRALLVLTYRDDEVGPRHPLRFVIGDLPRTNVRRMTLAPLSEASVAQLARQAGRPARDLHRITAGNPLFVTEVLAEVCDAVPASVRDAVLARALRLSPAAREIAELVSIVPNRTEAWLLEQTLPADERDEVTIDNCLNIGMVRHDDGALAFRHELARLALEDSLSQQRRQSLHARVLAALSQRTDISAARMTHHAHGARNADAVLRLAPLAAMQAAAVGAHREAASHYLATLRYAISRSACERAQLLDKLSYEYYLTDQVEASIEARCESLGLWRSEGAQLQEGDTLRWLSRLSWFAGRRAEAYDYAAQAVNELERLPPGPELAMAYSNRAQLDMLGHAAQSAIEWASRTIELTEGFDRPDILSHALNNLGSARLLTGDSAGWADLERSLQLALQGGFQEHVARAYTNLSSMAVTHHLYERALRHLSAGLAYCDERDLDSWRLYMLAWRARARFEQGDWQRASEDAEAVLQHPRTAPITCVGALIVLGQLRIRRGDPEGPATLERARLLAGPIQELQRSGPLVAALADAAMLDGDHASIAREVQPVYLLALQCTDVWMRGELAAWLRRAGALETAPPDIAAPYALEIAGDWRGAAHLWGQIGCPYEQATLLAQHGTESEQREALQIFEQLGAHPAAQALRRTMRAKGVRRVPRGLRTSTRNNALGLTRREAEILQLLAEGLRNSTIATRLFLSTKTVDHHVSAILAKLGVPSRAAAAAMARGKQQ